VSINNYMENDENESVNSDSEISSLSSNINNNYNNIINSINSYANENILSNNTSMDDNPNEIIENLLNRNNLRISTIIQMLERYIKMRSRLFNLNIDKLIEDNNCRYSNPNIIYDDDCPLCLLPIYINHNIINDIGINDTVELFNKLNIDIENTDNNIHHYINTYNNIDKDLDSFNKSIIIINKCEHRYHTNCFTKMIKETHKCAMCRSIII